jgi:hypothetical protein
MTSMLTYRLLNARDALSLISTKGVEKGPRLPRRKRQKHQTGSGTSSRRVRSTSSLDQGRLNSAARFGGPTDGQPQRNTGTRTTC